MVKMLFLVGAGGFFGSICRFLVQDWFVKNVSIGFPWGTFTANIIGSLIIGIIYTIVDKQGIFSQEIRLLFAVGFCGGFTTFSSFAMEKFGMLQRAEFLPFFAYMAISVIAGLFMVWVGIYLGRIITQ